MTKNRTTSAAWADIVRETFAVGVVQLGKSIQEFGEKIARPSKGRGVHRPNRRTIRARPVTASHAT